VSHWFFEVTAQTAEESPPEPKCGMRPGISHTSCRCLLVALLASVYPISGELTESLTESARGSQEMVSAWRDFTTGDFSMERVNGNHLFVYDHGVRDEWFETITDTLVGEGF
jgi:hypothetical protein